MGLMQLRDLIRCDHCGMSYDGDANDNCPHCLAPRPPRRGGQSVFYADDVPYHVVGGDPQDMEHRLDSLMSRIEAFDKTIC